MTAEQVVAEAGLEFVTGSTPDTDWVAVKGPLGAIEYSRRHEDDPIALGAVHYHSPVPRDADADSSLQCPLVPVECYGDVSFYQFNRVAPHWGQHEVLARMLVTDYADSFGST